MSDADLKAVLHRHLKGQRAALLAKLEGLSERDARLPRTATGTNLLGLVKHVAACELEYFGVVFGRPSAVPLPWDAAGVGEDDNVDCFATEDESMAEVLAWAESCFAHADATIEALDLGAAGSVPWWREGHREVTLGQILSHVALDEARHAGHADILREQLDGQVGMRPGAPNLPGWDEERWGAYVERLRAIAESHG